MTLKEKFTERLYNQSHDDSECLRIRFENIDKVINSQEKIADEFAIGFADWFHENCYEDQIGYYTASELLETYKRQKGL